MDIISTKFINRIFPVIFIMMFASITAQTAHAGSLEPESAMKAYTKAEKTCKQLERDHEKMKGEHELMFKAWKEKSSPLLIEDEELLTECKTAVSTLKEISEKLEKTGSNDPLKETLTNDYEKIQGVIEKITNRHKSLRKEHDKLFHEMMGH